jgi:hypothetical protein
MGLWDMRHYVHRCNGLVHVTNMVGPYEGQHHVHTPAGFRTWRKGVEAACVDLKGVGPCHCGLTPGQARDRDGHITTLVESVDHKGGQ